MAENNNKEKKASSKGGGGGYRQNPRETVIPDPETLREQWSYAKRQYSRWYSSAWGTAILAGLSFYALGWFIKGSNPALPSSLSSSSPNNNITNNKNTNNINQNGDSNPN